MANSVPETLAVTYFEEDHFPSRLLASKVTSFPIDYASIIANAPIGIFISLQLKIVHCNLAAAKIFGFSNEILSGMSFSSLYPSLKESEHQSVHVSAEMSSISSCSGERIMQRSNGDLFWCRVCGTASQRDDGTSIWIWTVTEIRERNEISKVLSARERQIAPFLLSGKTSKVIAREIGLSFRTIDFYRLRMMRKLAVKNYKELASRLVMDRSEHVN